MKPTIAHVAIDIPLRRYFDYILTPTITAQIQPGMRVLVPFGRRRLIGVVLAVDQCTSLSVAALKPVSELIDEQPLLSIHFMKLCTWASRYYQHPIGEVVVGILPKLLRQGHVTMSAPALGYEVTEQGLTLSNDHFKRAPRRQALWRLILEHPQIPWTEIRQQQFTKSQLEELLKNEWIRPVTVLQKVSPAQENQPLSFALNPQQQQAVEAICNAQGFTPFVLEGVTGSGKTEVYLQAIAHALKLEKTALVLVPEIALTPQTLARFSERFSVAIVLMHSGLTDRERLDGWLQAQQGKACIVIGARSAVFAPLKNLGIIIVDEEHDTSFKQQAGFRYSARDVAVRRAQSENIPIVMGSATVSLESLFNIKNGRYRHLQLTKRVGVALPPTFQLVDMRSEAKQSGLSRTLITAMREQLRQGNQVLLFLNRRGFSPVFLCHACGWQAQCRRCDAKLTVHLDPKRLICHHCDASQSWVGVCPECQSEDVLHVGVGTEQLQDTLTDLFPEYALIRIDRDTTRKKNSLHDLLKSIADNKAKILIGTQMLAKGHHFPNVTLVGIIDADSGFFSSDFRASERTAQLIIQVGGRAGRGDKLGRVLIQSHQPQHPLLQCLLKAGYGEFAQQLLVERHEAKLPPTAYLALLRAEAKKPGLALNFLTSVKNLLSSPPGVRVCGPLPALMERRSGYFRAQLLFCSAQRMGLQQNLTALLDKISALNLAKKVRWSIDVDPFEVI